MFFYFYFSGKCDTVIEQMMLHLGLSIPKYQRELDPIFHHATILHEVEMHTTSRSPIEKFPKEKSKGLDGVKQESVDGMSSICSSPGNISQDSKVIAVAEKDDSSTNDLIVSNILGQ